MRASKLIFVSALVAVAGCTTEPLDEGVLDGENESFGSGAADSLVPECDVLKVANTSDLKTLDDDARLHRVAAENIVKYRAGDDGIDGTQDDRFFQSLVELDRVRYVGPSALRRLQQHAQAEAVICGEVAVQLLSFNDFHGALKAPSGSGGRIQTGADPNVDRVDAGGVEFMHTYVRDLAATNPNTVVVAAGDVIGATPLLSALFHDEPTVESMNLLGLQIAAVGNHEFDEGLDELQRIQHGGCHPVDGCQDGDDFDGAAYTYLGANVIDDASGVTVLPPYELRRFGNATVAFIGMTLENTPLVTTAAGVEGLTFRDEAETVNALVPALKSRGVESIVVLLHEGGAQTGLYNECVGISGALVDVVTAFDPAVDVVVAGHTNAAHICNIDGKLVTSAASNGRLVTDIDLVIDERTGDVTTANAENVIVTRTVAKAAEQTALIAKYEVFAAPMANRVTGAIADTLFKAPNDAGESTMGDLVADAQLAAGRAAGAEIAFMNPGGIRTDLVVDQISGGEQLGEVTYGELFAVQPFGNTLIVMTMTGEQVHAVLEQQWRMAGGAELAVVLQVSAGFSYTYDSTRAIGDRVDPADVTVNGVPLDLGAEYRVVLNGFLADGGDGFAAFRGGTQRVPSAVDVDALESFLVANSPWAATPLDRIGRR